MEQVRCAVRGVFVAISEAATVPVVILADDAGRLLPIYVGLWEAVSINSAQNNEVPPRPFTHDLFLDLMAKFAISVDRLSIDSMEEGVYYAHLAISAGGRTESLDCRPSDGIAVALRARAPLFADEELFTGTGREESLSAMVELSAFLRK
jgi:hypothetical protein